MPDKENICKYTELRRIKPKSMFELSAILEQNEGWKLLMSIIPKDIDDMNGILKYTTEDMRLIEEASNKQGRSCSEILFEEWGTSGRKRPTFKTLQECLLRAELFRAAEFVAVSILNEDLPTRPNDGPAANIALDNIMADVSRRTLDFEQSSYAVDNNYNYSIDESVLSIQLQNTLAYDEHDEQILNVVSNFHNCNVNSADKYSSSVSTVNTVIDQKCKPDSTSPNVISYSLLINATNNFSEGCKIGSGAFGTVYRGKIDLAYNFELAIKVLKDPEVGINLLKQLKSEVDILSRCKHENILPLVAISLDKIPCLIYEYMPNGSLEDRIACKREIHPLDWKKRVDISCGIADGLHYLHFGCEKRIVHRDIKSANVLLNITDIPKIGDFGLVRATSITKHTTVTETIIGTTAYMSPEAFRGDVSIQLDVYSFGVVLLELITGLPPYDENRDGTDLVTHTDTADVSLEEMVDQKSGLWDKEVLSKIIVISEKCLLEKKRRPYSKDIFLELSNIKLIYNNNN